MGIEGYLWNPMVHHLSAWRKNHLPGPEVSPDVLHCNALLDVFQQSFEWQTLGMETTNHQNRGSFNPGIGSKGQRFDLEIWSWLTMTVLTKILSGCGQEVPWFLGALLDLWGTEIGFGVAISHPDFLFGTSQKHLKPMGQQDWTSNEHMEVPLMVEINFWTNWGMENPLSIFFGSNSFMTSFLQWEFLRLSYSSANRYSILLTDRQNNLKEIAQQATWAKRVHFGWSKFSGERDVQSEFEVRLSKGQEHTRWTDFNMRIPLRILPSLIQKIINVAEFLWNWGHEVEASLKKTGWHYPSSHNHGSLENHPIQVHERKRSYWRYTHFSRNPHDGKEGKWIWMTSQESSWHVGHNASDRPPGKVSSMFTVDGS